MSTSGRTESLERVADGVWCVRSPVQHLGLRLTTTMTVLRLGDGTVLLHSPVAMTPERRASVEAIGPIAHLYAPNTYHHLWVGEWAESYPSARLHAPSGLATKRPDLRIDHFHDRPGDDLAFADVVATPIDGFLLQESVLFHRPTRTLVVADLVHNLEAPRHLWTKIYSRMMGFCGCVALSRMIRWTAFRDRASARRSLDRVLGFPFERIVVGHGAPVTVDAHGALASAYAWLPRARAALPARVQARRADDRAHGERPAGARPAPPRRARACG